MSKHPKGEKPQCTSAPKAPSPFSETQPITIKCDNSLFFLATAQYKGHDVVFIGSDPANKTNSHNRIEH